MKSCIILFFILSCLTAVNSIAQNKVSKMQLSFEKKDTLNICKVHVTSGDSVVRDVSVKLFVQRMFSELPVGKSISTNEGGIAAFIFPKDIPADRNGKLVVIAKITDDENYGNAETKAEINWGTQRPASNAEDSERTLWASRGLAPVFLIIASNLIILSVWGTLIYVVVQAFRIKKIGKKLINK
jgi:hypothetical protein